MRELVKSAVLGADGVCMTFMKQIAGELMARVESRERSPEARCRLWRTVKGLGVSVPGLPGLFSPETGLFRPHNDAESNGKITGRGVLLKQYVLPCLVFLPAKLRA